MADRDLDELLGGSEPTAVPSAPQQDDMRNDQLARELASLPKWKQQAYLMARRGENRMGPSIQAAAVTAANPLGVPVPAALGAAGAAVKQGLAEGSVPGFSPGTREAASTAFNDIRKKEGEIQDKSPSGTLLGLLAQPTAGIERLGAAAVPKLAALGSKIEEAPLLARSTIGGIKGYLGGRAQASATGHDPEAAGYVGGAIGGGAPVAGAALSGLSSLGKAAAAKAAPIWQRLTDPIENTMKYVGVEGENAVPGTTAGDKVRASIQRLREGGLFNRNEGGNLPTLKDVLGRTQSGIDKQEETLQSILKRADTANPEGSVYNPAEGMSIAHGQTPAFSGSDQALQSMKASDLLTPNEANNLGERLNVTKQNFQNASPSLQAINEIKRAQYQRAYPPQGVFGHVPQAEQLGKVTGNDLKNVVEQGVGKILPEEAGNVASTNQTLGDLLQTRNAAQAKYAEDFTPAQHSGRSILHDVYQAAKKAATPNQLRMAEWGEGGGLVGKGKELLGKAEKVATTTKELNSYMPPGYWQRAMVSAATPNGKEDEEEQMSIPGVPPQQ